MAIALTNIERHNAGDLFVINATLTFSGTYSASASVTAAQLGLTGITEVLGASEGGYIFSPVKNAKPTATSFIPHLFVGTPAEASGTITEVVNLRVTGR